MSEQKNKRMIYIYDENLDFYDGLKNKSEFFNEALKAAKLKTPNRDTNIEYIQAKIRAMDEANRR